MNRFFAITGFLAAGMAAFWVQLFIFMPWIWGSSPKASPLIWCVWGGISIVGVAIVLAFICYSFAAHWAALRRNTPMPRAAWRGVGVVYLLVTILFAIPVLAMDTAGSHRNERYLYAGLTALGLLLTVISFRRGFRRIT